MFTSNYLAQNYASQVGLYNAFDKATNGDGLGFDGALCSLNSSPFSMNNSIYNMGGYGDYGGIGYSGIGNMNFGGGYGMGNRAMAMYNNMTPEEMAAERLKLNKLQMASQEELENYQIDAQVRRKHKMEGAEFRYNSPNDLMTRQIGNLQKEVKENEQDHILSEYGRLKETAIDKLKEAGIINPDEAQIRAYIEKEYFKATGKGLAEDIEANGDSSFLHGLKQGSGLGLGALFTNKQSKDKTLSYIKGTELPTGSKSLGFAGQILGGVATVAVIPLALAGLIGGGKVSGKGYAKLWKSLFSKC